MHQHWAVEPPLEQLVYYLASYAGWKPTPKSASQLSDEEQKQQVEALLGAFGMRLGDKGEANVR
jgi:hypothetical protein